MKAVQTASVDNRRGAAFEQLCGVVDVPKPTPGPGEILVKVHYAAQNPTDWKSCKAISSAGRTLGCDFSGVVEASGEGVTQWKEGERVAGWVHGARAVPHRGAFAEYLVTEPELLFAVPDSVSLEDASTISLPVATAVQAIFQRMGLSSSPSEANSKTWILINGGSSSVGLYAVQLAKLAGLRVIATGSASNHDWIKSLGASETVDYRDDNWPAKAREITNDGIQFGFDCISEKGTVEKVCKAMSAEKGGHVVCLLPIARVKAALPQEVQNKVKLESTIAYSCFGREIPDYHVFDNSKGEESLKQDKAFWVEYLEKIPEWLSSGKVKPNKTKLLGGLDQVPHGFKIHENGEVRVEKIVYKVAA